MWRPGWGWTAAAWLAWSGLATGLGVYAFFHPVSHTVYPIYATAARLWWTGQDIYHPAVEFYRYSPLFAITLTPIALLPDAWGGALWKALNCLGFAAALAVWARHALPARLSRDQLAALLLLAVPLSLHSAYIGQANLTMLSLLLLGLAAAANGRWNWAAGCLAGATLIKGYPLALALVLMALYLRRLPLRFLAALALGLLLPFATQWPEVVAGQYANWFAHLRESTGILRERLRSIDHLFVLYGRPLPPGVFAQLGVIAGAVVPALAALEARWAPDRRALLTRVWLLFSAWAVLFGPATESCTYVVMAPAIAWAVVDAYLRPTWPVTRLLLVASLLMMGPLVTDLFGPAVRAFANYHGSQAVGALLFLAHLLAQTGRRPGQTASAEPAPGSEPLRPAA
jgi:hypothetical protein